MKYNWNHVETVAFTFFYKAGIPIMNRFHKTTFSTYIKIYSWIKKQRKIPTNVRPPKLIKTRNVERQICHPDLDLRPSDPKINRGHLTSHNQSTCEI